MRLCSSAIESGASLYWILPSLSTSATLGRVHTVPSSRSGNSPKLVAESYRNLPPPSQNRKTVCLVLRASVSASRGVLNTLSTTSLTQHPSLLCVLPRVKRKCLQHLWSL